MTVHPLRFMLVSAVALMILVLLAALAAVQAGSAMERTLIVFFVSLTAVAGMGLYSGNSGILSFGHLAFMGIAAYVSGILTMPVQMKQLTLPNLPDLLADTSFSFGTSALIAVLFAMLVALAVGLVISRLEGSAATIATLGLLIIVHGVIIGARDFTRGAQSFFGVPRETDIWVAAAACAGALLIARWFRDSVPGLRLRASREDAIAAGSTGVHIRRERLLAWVLSAGVVALAGVVLGHFLGAFSPKKFYFADTFFLLAMLIVGGMGTVTGAILGATVITLVTEVLRRLEGGVEVLGMQLPAVFGTTQIGIGLIILFVMFRRSGGLAGEDEWDERLLGRLARTQPRAGDEDVLPSLEPGHALTGERLSRSFSGLTAVDDVSISIEPDEIVGLIGPNGSGKTTLLNLLSGVQEPGGGDVFRGQDRLAGKPAYAYARAGIARTFQNIRLFRSLSAQQNVLVAALGEWPRLSVRAAVERTGQTLERAGIAHLAHLKAGTLAYGDQRRLEIARALALRPSVLLLDEPAAGMNRSETDALAEMLKQLRSRLGIGILVVDHDLALIVRLCDRVIVLNEGRIIASGPPEDVQRDPQVVEAYLGKRHRTDLSAVQTPGVQRPGRRVPAATLRTETKTTGDS